MQSVKITSDKDNRLDFKNQLLNKVETALTPPPIPVEPEPEVIEILDKYSTWIPARLALESEELLPDFKKEEAYIPQHELAERATVKKSLLNKVEEFLTPVEEIEAAPVEIIEKYSNWTPARLSIEPQETLEPNFKVGETVIFPREVEKRTAIKQNLLNKIETSLVPVPAPVEVEPTSVEIVEKFAKGIPQHGTEEAEPFFSDTRIVIHPVILAADVPKRLAFKKSLLSKVNTSPITEEIVEPIIGEYSQRTIAPYGLDFEEANRPALIVSKLQETIVDFVPVIEEAPLPVLRLPENYGELNERALYGVLIRNTDLRHTSETANLALDVLAGRSSTQVEFVIVEAPKVVQPIVSVPESVVNVPEIIVSVQVEPVVIVPEPVIIEPFNFDLPSDWQSVPLSTLRTDLLATGATPEQVDAKMASLVEVHGKDLSVEDFEAETLSIDLPEEFNSWKPISQYIYLTKERLLTPDQANTVVYNSNLEH